jgi:hypothetical protein
MEDVAGMEVLEVPAGLTETEFEGRLIEELGPLHNVQRNGGSGRLATTGAGLEEGRASYLLKAPQSEMDAWRAAAKAEGVSFAGWLRGAASARLGAAEAGRPIVSEVPSAAMRSSKQRVAERAGCSARTPSGSWCKTCGAVHK